MNIEFFEILWLGLVLLSDWRHAGVNLSFWTWDSFKSFWEFL